MILVDAHEDLAWNMLTFQRDYSRSAAEIRQSEAGSAIWQWNGDTLLGWEEYQRGQVMLIFSTLFAAPVRKKLGDWDTQCYTDSRQAKKLYRAQVEAYLSLVEQNPQKFTLIQTRNDLQNLQNEWQQAKDSHPVGLLMLMEGAEAIEHPEEVETWWNSGVRILGPAWAGNAFCGGTNEPGRLTKLGEQLLESMANVGFALDLSHMDEPAALQALDFYEGIVIATHANAKALLRGIESNRHLSDRLIHRLIERDGVIGVIPYNAFLKAGWREGEPREEVTLLDLVAHIDHICQLAGDSQHVGIGSDFDGGFGWQSVPVEINTIADLQKIVPLLSERGYATQDITNIFHGNWLRCCNRFLP
ncbi:MAG: Membrane dipeptidase [Anaerolineae bacterium]|jgi:membrane dipeptidase|nr:MAG: Membrane dipeptidase [Anaerolineae bacterium]